MATYKVLQDIESEDKLFGPFTLKQFIFGAITIAIGFIEFTLLTSGALGLFRWPFFLLFLPPMIVFGFLSAPLSRDQPNEIWLLARLRFLLKPHRRVWDQDGMNELVTITAPKREVHTYTNNLTQTEVQSRLQALANTVDSRGWAVKNVNTNLFAEPGYLSQDDSDRLVGLHELPQEVSPIEVLASDDIMDPLNNPTAQHLTQLVQESAKTQKQTAIDHMRDKVKPKPNDYWFMNQQSPPTTQVPANYSTFSNQQVVAPGTADAHPAAEASAEEQALGHKLAAQQQATQGHVNDHIKNIQPLHDREGKIVKAPTQAEPKPQPATTNPAIAGLAYNDDLNVATIARQAKKITKDDDEVVISLH